MSGVSRNTDSGEVIPPYQPPELPAPAPRGDDRAYASDLLDRLLKLAPLGGECRDVAVENLRSELRLARRLGEIDGRVTS